MITLAPGLASGAVAPLVVVVLVVDDSAGLLLLLRTTVVGETLWSVAVQS